jgi:glycosyltransferase involved in cell wall biosynthesis
MADSGGRVKVCHVFAGTKGGRWVFDQLLALRDDHGCEVAVVLGGAEGPTVDLFRAAGIPVHVADFALGGWRLAYRLPFRALRLAWWFRQRRFDVVQSHVIQSTLLARPAAWLADVPVRLTMVTGPFFIEAPATRRVEQATAWMETGIIPSCVYTADKYRAAGIPERQIMPVLYYGPPADRFDPATGPPAGLRAQYRLPPDAPLIGSVAIFYPRMQPSAFVPPTLQGRLIKGHEELVRAMPAVLARHPEARLVLVGTGWGEAGEATMGEVAALAEATGVGNRVIFTGYRPDIAAIYRDLDVSVQASLNENLGGTVESLLMARPTVATRVGGMTDSVIDCETGLLVNPSDPDDLARAINRLLDNRVAAAQLGAAGRTLMLSRFTLETTARGLAALYRDQRAARRGAWRLSRLPIRLSVGAALASLLFTRALFVDHLLLRRLRGGVERRINRLRGLIRFA